MRNSSRPSWAGRMPAPFAAGSLACCALTLLLSFNLITCSSPPKPPHAPKPSPPPHHPPSPPHPHPPRPPPNPRPPRPPPPSPSPPPPPINFTAGYPDPQLLLGSNPLNCSAWADKRIYLEAQQWFTALDADIVLKSKHIHLGLCAPYNSTLSGIVPVDVLVQLHNNADFILQEITAEVVSTSGSGPESRIPLGRSGFLGLDCSLTAGNCQAVYRVWINTALSLYDGLYAIRLSSSLTRSPGSTSDDLTQGEGFSHNVVLSFKANFSNNKTTDPTDNAALTPNPTFGRGTMSFPWSYTEAFVMGSLPTHAVSGVWHTPVLNTQQHAGSASVTRSFISLDPAIHRGVVGTVLLDNSTTPGGWTGSLTINTTALANGYHKLFIRTDAFVAPFSLPNSAFPPERPFPGGTNSGILLVGFQVQN